MAPHTPETDSSEPLVDDDSMMKLVAPQAAPWKMEIYWRFVFLFIYYHLASIYGLYFMFTSASWATIAFSCVAFYLSAMGSNAGAHRLWSHKSYKARTPLQIFLMLCFCMSNQYTMFLWARDHRLHHKHSDTDADPYNATRGFVYSHVGWLCVERHPEMEKRGKLVDMSDLLSNPVVMFQKRHKTWMNLLFCFVLPTLIPIYFWNEAFSVAYHVNMFRATLSINGTFAINSLAHMFGTKPYDKGIAPSQNIITTLTTLGEGFHNYHHTFPYDYKAGELGSFLNFSASFIDFCAWFGLAYDRKSVSQDVLEKRVLRTGDESADKYGTSVGLFKKRLV